MKDTKFAIRHKESKKWVKIWFGIGLEGYVHLMNEFHSDVLYSSKNLIEEDLSYAHWGDGRKGFVDPKEFEIMTIEITYKLPD